MNLPFILDIALGLVFTYLILSLLASEIQELIATVLQWRAAHLRKSIEILLAGGTRNSEEGKIIQLVNNIYSNPLVSNINQEAKGFLATLPRKATWAVSSLTRPIKIPRSGATNNDTIFGNGKHSGPSYIPADIYATTLMETLQIPDFSQKLSESRVEKFKNERLNEIQNILFALEGQVQGDEKFVNFLSLMYQEFAETQADFEQILWNYNQKKADLHTSISRMAESVDRYIQVFESEMPKSEYTAKALRKLKFSKQDTFASQERAITLGGLQPNVSEIVQLMKKGSKVYQEFSEAIKDKDNNSNNLYDNANQRKKLIYKALALLDELPESQQKVYAAINLANLSADDKITSPLTQCSTKRKLSDDKILGLLNVAVKTANNLQDSRSKSFALGAAGHFYECQNNYNQALELTYKAILAADYKLQAKDSLYLWKWQQARLLEKTGNQSDAISAYERAFLTLEKIRSDITSSNKDLQLNFRDVIQPLYRKLASLKLEQATTKVSFNQKNILKSGKRNQRNKEFNQALEIIDSLRLAELQNYFGNDCITTAITTQKVDELLGGSEGKTAVISSIFLDDRVAILLDLPDKSQHIEWIEKINNQKISKQELEAEIINFLTDLRGQQRFRVDDSPEAQKVYKNARKLYDLIIRPFEEKGYLNQEKIQTIVFVQDGLFRSIPMSALIDKNSGKYLIEKYAIATTPSLRLTAPKQNNREINRAMLFGFNEEAEIDGKLFDSLQFVNSEIEALKKLFSSSKILRYEDLIPSDITDIKDKPRKNIFPIILIATHAQFGFTPEDTFLVMGKNRKLTISELEKFLTGISDNINTLELLTLSACQTATGDERANLGLAGVALETGVKSALASLWAVNDESTSILVREFYQNLRAGETKARALQQAQIALIRNTNQTPGIREEYSKPYYWSPFIMIGNWL